MSPGLHLGSYGIAIDPAGRLLMVRMSQGPDSGRWTLPGGGVEWGEDPEGALRREMAEETGLEGLKISSPIRIYSHLYPEDPQLGLEPVHHVGIIYRLELSSFDLRAEENGSTDLPRWLTESQVRTLPLTPLGEFALLSLGI